MIVSRQVEKLTKIASSGASNIAIGALEHAPFTSKHQNRPCNIFDRNRSTEGYRSLCIFVVLPGITCAFLVKALSMNRPRRNGIDTELAC